MVLVFAICIGLTKGISHWHCPGPEVIKLFSSSIQVSMKIFLLINVKMPTVVGILTFISWKNRILGLYEPAKS